MTQINIETVEIVELTPQEFFQKKDQYTLIDVRTQEEWEEDGHAEMATHAPLGPDFEKWAESAAPNQNYAFVCRSGRRSDMAARYAKAKGVKEAANILGGMIAWGSAGLPMTEQK